jgi:hypothetical protein
LEEFNFGRMKIAIIGSKIIALGERKFYGIENCINYFILGKYLKKIILGQNFLF